MPGRAVDDQRPRCHGRCRRRSIVADPDDFATLPIRGYAAPHTLTLDLGDDRGPAGAAADRLDRLRVLQRQRRGVAVRPAHAEPPSLQVRDGHGAGRRSSTDIGFPVGRPQTLVVDLTGKWLAPASARCGSSPTCGSTGIGFVVDTSAPRAADLGHARSIRSPRTCAGAASRPKSGPTATSRRLRLRTASRRSSPWKTMPGRYTREGDVRALLARTDDMFVDRASRATKSRSRSTRRRPPLPAGWTRTFLLDADGFSKEMDINSASPDAVAPLPFHADDALSVWCGRALPERSGVPAYREVQHACGLADAADHSMSRRAVRRAPRKDHHEHIRYSAAACQTDLAEPARPPSDAREHASACCA